MAAERVECGVWSVEWGVWSLGDDLHLFNKRSHKLNIKLALLGPAVRRCPHCLLAMLVKDNIDRDKHTGRFLCAPVGSFVCGISFATRNQ